MKAFLLFLTLALSTSVMAQNDNWKVSHNGKVRLSASEENEKNLVEIKAAELNKKGLLSIAYKEVTPQADWQREIMIFDPSDNEFKRGKGSLLKIQNADLKKLFGKSKTLMIYTMSLPKDPNLAATVRVRRVHLCTLVLK
jgi:hypothetical protein